MPTSLQREETQYFYDPSLDALYPGPPQELERADTEYDFDHFSTQGMEEVAEIERQAIAKMDNTEATLRSPLQDEPAAIGEDEGNTEVIERSQEEMDVEENMIHYLTPEREYSSLNYKVLSAISQGSVAYIRGHYESRPALWSPKTCFAELGIKPQFEARLHGSVSRIVSLQF
jgi:hypothetical protein